MNSTFIDITVTPKSSRSQINIDEQNNIKAYLNSPPADGKANTELIKLLSKKLKISKSSMKIIQGDKSRKKRISIQGLSKEEVLIIFKSK
jgi:uncharacterized protein